MKVNELRIGNLVSSDNANVCKVNGFSPFGHSVRCDEEEGCNIHFDIIGVDGNIDEGWDTDSNDIKPIRLTILWLIKFGFQLKKEKIGTMGVYGKGDVNLRLSNSGNVYRKISHPILHVHQLQNLYFALTGTEL